MHFCGDVLEQEDENVNHNYDDEWWEEEEQRKRGGGVKIPVHIKKFVSRAQSMRWAKQKVRKRRFQTL